MDIPLSSDALDLTFHPSSSTNLLAVGLISGKIQLIDYSDYLSSPSSSRTPAQPPLKKSKTTSSPPISEDQRPKLYRKVYTSRPSKKSCRGLHFSTTGTSIFSVSKDKSLYSTDTETGKVVQSWDEVHEAPPSRVLPVDENLVVTGDDEGVVRLWDVRKESGRGAKPVRQWEHHFDWITDMVYLPELPVPKRERKNEVKKSKLQLKKQRRRERQAALLKQHSAKDDDDDDDDDSDDDSDEPDKVESRSRLIVTSGDGSLSSIDLLTSGPTSFEQSEDQEDELLSITSIRSSTKLVVGTQLGILSLWTPSRGLLDHVDRVPGHPASVDTLVTLDSETVLTGSSDGLVRVVQILPSKLLGVIASHDGLPVERMKRKESVLASIGHSNSVKLTDLTPLLEDEEDGDSEGEGGALGIVGLAGDDQDSDDEDDDEEEEEEDDGDEQDDVAVGVDQDDQEDDDDDDDEEEADQNSDSEDVAPSKKKAAKGGFFSDL